MNGLTKEQEVKIESLLKALEAGNANAAPSALAGGAVLQTENLSKVMENATYDESHIQFQKLLKVKSVKSTIAQFNRRLSYGIPGGSAQLEGNIGVEQNAEYVRCIIPMAYYSEVRRVTTVAEEIATFDGEAALTRVASEAALRLAMDIERDLFFGQANFTNGGVFDGSPDAIPTPIANLHGADVQIRQSDYQRKTKDQMLGAFGNDESVVIPAGGAMTQAMLEDLSVRNKMNFGNAKDLFVDPKVASAYNKLVFGKERYNLPVGTPLSSTGGDLDMQWVNGGQVKLYKNRFISGRTGPDAVHPRVGLGAPTVTPTSVTTAGVVTSFTAAEVYYYFAVGRNEIGNGYASTAASVTIAVTGDEVSVSIAHGTVASDVVLRSFDVYRTAANAASTTAKYIGSVKALTSSPTIFHDFNNKSPGFVTGFFLQMDTWEIQELSPFSKKRLADVNLTTVEAHFRFLTLAGYSPRRNCLLENLAG